MVVNDEVEKTGTSNTEKNAIIVLKRFQKNV